MSVFDDMARDAGYRGDEAAQVARGLEEDERRRSETGCECSALEMHDGRCAGCGRSVVERVSPAGRPGADYEVLLCEVVRLRSGLLWNIAFNLLAIDPVNCPLCEQGHVPARPCSPVESAPWCADHVRESEESRMPKSGPGEAVEAVQAVVGKALNDDAEAERLLEHFKLLAESRQPKDGAA